MNSKIFSTDISRQLKLGILVFGALVTLQGCVNSLGGAEDTEEPSGICDGITEGFDTSVTIQACSSSGREYVIERGCYCGP